MSLDLCSIDILPPQCGIEVETEVDMEEGTLVAVRFRVGRPKRRWLRKGVEFSEWSGWFPYDDEPIALHWDAFWEDD